MKTAPPYTSKTRVKICGITNAKQAEWVAQAGADALGLVFYPPSARHVTVAAAQSVLKAVPPFVSVVALFRNPSVGQVQQVIASIKPDLLQFHGDESPEFCRQFSTPYLKAFGMAEENAGQVLSQTAQRYFDARGWLLDSHGQDKAGGSGQAFDWKQIPLELQHKIILAGGLGVNNVAAAIRQVRPLAVDVSSGVEISGGIKSQQKINAFMQQVRLADA